MVAAHRNGGGLAERRSPTGSAAAAVEMSTAPPSPTADSSAGGNLAALWTDGGLGIRATTPRTLALFVLTVLGTLALSFSHLHGGGRGGSTLVHPLMEPTHTGDVLQPSIRAGEKRGRGLGSTDRCKECDCPGNDGAHSSTRRRRGGGGQQDAGDNVVVARAKHRRGGPATGTPSDAEPAKSSSDKEEGADSIAGENGEEGDISADAFNNMMDGEGVAAAAAATAAARALPSILILTPVKNAGRHIEGYFRNLRSLGYPKSRISLGLMDSDSDDTPSEQLMARLSGSTHSRVQRVLRDAAAMTRKAAAAAAAVNATNGTIISSVSAEAAMLGARRDETKPRLTGTFARLLAELPSLSVEYRRVTLFQHDFGLAMARADRHGEGVQLARRAMLAKSRNHLLSTSLRDEEWVLW